MNKPFHQMTPAERTAARIAQNRSITARIAEHPIPIKGAGKAQKKVAVAQPAGEHIRMTPEERSRLGGVIRKVQS